MRYLISLPERLVRALAAAAGGFIFEATQVILPTWVRRSRLYQAVVYRLLRLVIELVGDVRGVYPSEPVAAGELAVRKAAGNVLELAGFVALGWSPLWLLAAASDLTGGTRVYLRALVSEFQRDGFLPEKVDIQSVDGLLQALESSSGAAADLIDIPPLNIGEMKKSWQALSQNAGGLPDTASLAEFYNSLQQVAKQEGRSLWAVSSLLAAGAVRAGVQLGSTYIFNYYQDALRAIGEEGWTRYAWRVTKPYLSAAASHLDPNRVSYTERALARLRKPAGEIRL
jgi:hypothetical protein